MRRRLLVADASRESLIAVTIRSDSQPGYYVRHGLNYWVTSATVFYGRLKAVPVYSPQIMLDGRSFELNQSEGV